MPYVPENDRGHLDPVCAPAHSKGELNFQISRLFNMYLMEHGLSYKRASDCTGAGTDAVEEFRRRIMNTYEDKKIIENGDVYDASILSKKMKCDRCDGSGSISTPTTHPTNPNLDGWSTVICYKCEGRGDLTV